MQHETIRAFIAVNLDVSTIRTLAALAGRLRELDLLPRARWVTPTKMHVTLRFLGSIDVGVAPALADGIRSIVPERALIGVRVSGGISFPSPEAARVVAAQIHDDAGELTRLGTRVEDVADGLGFPRSSRTFRPHVTLARTNEPLDARPTLRACDVDVSTVGVTEIALYRTDFARPAAEYTAIARFGLPR